MLTKQEQEILEFLDACDIEEGDIEKSGVMLDLTMIRDFVPKYLRKKQCKTVVDTDLLEQMRYACCSACNHEWKEPLGVDVNSVPCPECGDRVDKPETLKPRTKVEYVKADFNYFWECAKEFADGVEFFTADLANECKVNQVRTLEMLLASYKVGAILRKVETEITWQDEAKELLIPATRQYKHNNGIGFLCGYDCDETVQIVADLIEKCHQQVN